MTTANWMTTMTNQAASPDRTHETGEQPRRRISGWAWILVAGVFEVGFTFAMKMQQTEPRFQIMFLACVIASFECLARGIRTVPLSIGYAVWTGIGSVGTFVLGVTIFDESLNPVRVLLIAGLIAALVTLKVVASQGSRTPDVVS